MDNPSCGPKQSRTRQRYPPHNGTPQVGTNERTKLPGRFTRTGRHTDRHHGTNRQGHSNMWDSGTAIPRHHRQRSRNPSGNLKGRGKRHCRHTSKRQSFPSYNRSTWRQRKTTTTRCAPIYSKRSGRPSYARIQHGRIYCPCRVSAKSR